MPDRNPLFADLPLGTIITDELRRERLQDPKYFSIRNFSCPVCHESMEYSGSRPIYDGSFSMVVTGVQYLFYCKSCNANIEYLRLQP
jgi:transcription initiation factor IIE alpha subunit